MTSQRINLQDLDRIKQLCKEAGIKATHQRFEIFKELLSAKDHPSAELVHKRLQKKMPSIAIDTVYRTLATFDEFGIIKKLHISNERTLFDTNLKIHHHFFCTRCKKVEDFYWPDFDKANLPEAVAGIGEVLSRHLEVHGICSQCMNKADEE